MKITQSEKFRHDIVQTCADTMTNGYRFNYINESSRRNPNNVPKRGKINFHTIHCYNNIMFYIYIL